MKSLKHNQQGFVTMIVIILVIITAVVFLAYSRVSQVQQ